MKNKGDCNCKKKNSVNDKARAIGGEDIIKKTKIYNSIESWIIKTLLFIGATIIIVPTLFVLIFNKGHKGSYNKFFKIRK